MHALVPHIEDLNVESANLFVIGKPGSGKSYIAAQIAQAHPNHVLIEAEEFILHQYTEIQYQRLKANIIENIDNGKNVIFVGHLCHEILLRLPQKYLPEVILEIVISDKCAFDIYRFERDTHKYNAAMYHYDKRREKILSFIKNSTVKILLLTVSNERTIHRHK